MGSWTVGEHGVLALPSGRLVRGRALRRPMPEGAAPEFGLYLLGRPPRAMPWPWRWIRWMDFGLPSDQAQARAALVEAWEQAGSRRVEVACGGGTGRTGTALACLAVLDSVPSGDAVAWVRRRYHPRAVETPWQRRYVTHLLR